MIRDIDRARKTCHLEFYIWNLGGVADEVAEALIRANKRGVVCRVLVDDVGSRAWLVSSLAQRLREEGVQVCSALPVGFFRTLLVRLDLRMHRKIVVIDGEIAYTGSLNLVDPRFFKQESGVGQWVDAMVRMRGPALEPLAITFLSDWAIEEGSKIEQLQKTVDVRSCEGVGDSTIQVMPSGPSFNNEKMEQILLTAVYMARSEIIFTSPYFVPDEKMLTALISATRRGVNVTIIVPSQVDSRLTHYASHAQMGSLLEAGVRIMKFNGGLLHTKSITVDGEFSLFGTLNLDPRSLFLNSEITLGIYDKQFTSGLKALQQQYILQSDQMNIDSWRDRSVLTRFLENVVRLIGPLL